MQSSITNYESI